MHIQLTIVLSSMSHPCVKWVTLFSFKNYMCFLKYNLHIINISNFSIIKEEYPSSYIGKYFSENDLFSGKYFPVLICLESEKIL